jgi:acyl-CoA synthetase (AMP-forming)/AMP-acid ligase II
MWPGFYAARTPDKAAIIMAESGEVTTYAQLDAASNRLAQLFHARGLRWGDHIAVCMENCALYLAATWAAQRSGLVYTPINFHLTAEEMAYIVGDCDARALIVSGGLGDTPTALAAQLGPQVTIRLAAGGAVPGYESYEDAVAAQPATALAEELEGSPMLYSSGTTGRPKGVAQPHPHLPMGSNLPLMENFCRLYSVTNDAVYLSPAPLYHAAPLHFSMSILRAGGTVVVMERFDPIEALALIERYQVTHSQWVPTMFVRFLKLTGDERARHDLSSHRIAIHAAAPCPVAVKEQMIEWWGRSCSSTTRPPRASAPRRSTVPTGSRTGVRSDGRSPVPSTSSTTTAVSCRWARAVACSSKSPRRFRSRTTRTQPRPPRCATPTAGARWATSATSTPRAILYLTDRKDFMIVSGGVNIYPQEIENLLITHPQIADVAVFGVPNDEMGEEVKAVVQPLDMAQAGPALAATLQDFCRQHLARYKCPRTIDFTAELPRAPTGKLYKRLLRDKYWEGRSKRIN